MLVNETLETALVVAAWFALNIAMGNTTKWLFLYGNVCKEDTGCRSFKFPLTVTVIHMIFSWAMCHFYLAFRYHGRSPTDKKRVVLTLEQQYRKIAPLSICFALSVAMGNLSLKYIYPSFNQMLGAMSPLITVLMAVTIQGKRYNRWTWMSMPVICGGLAVCSLTEMNFHALGAAYATGATVLRAAKSLIQARLLSSAEKMDSVTLLYYMSPWAAAFLMILAASSEGTKPFELIIDGFLSQPGIPLATGSELVLALLAVSGMNACLLNLSNFLVTSYTSAVTLQVLGNVKSCLGIAVSITIFRNSLRLEQIGGVMFCLTGVWLYNRFGAQVKEPQISHKEDMEIDPAVTVEMQQHAEIVERSECK